MYEIFYNTKTRYSSLLFFLITTLCFFSCFGIEPNEYEGPLFPLSDEGKNILTFEYDEEVWINETNNQSAIECYHSISTNGDYEFEISGYSRFEQYITINLSFIIDSNLQQINDDSFNYVVLSESGFNSCNDFIPLTSDINISVIKLDTIKRIVAGEFSVPVLSNNCGETMSIRKGRFDLKYFKI